MTVLPPKVRSIPQGVVGEDDLWLNWSYSIQTDAFALVSYFKGCSEKLPSWWELCCNLDGLKWTHYYYEWNDNLEEQKGHNKFRGNRSLKRQQVEKSWLEIKYKTTQNMRIYIYPANKKEKKRLKYTFHIIRPPMMKGLKTVRKQ